MKLLHTLTLLLAVVGVQQVLSHPAAPAGPEKNQSGKPTGTANNKPPPTNTVPGASVTLTINGNARAFPAPDRTPNANDPIAKAWLKEADLSKVPQLPLSNAGVINYTPTTCGPPTQILPDQGSWTCQKFVAPDDISDCPNKNTWGLTYDDGPSEFTPTLLAALKSNNIKATFFVVGSRVAAYPNILNDTLNQGHHLAVHTWSHPALTSINNPSVYLELRWTQEIIKHVTGLTPKDMRPPFGDTDNRVRAISRVLKLRTIVWTQGFDSNDWGLLSGKTIGDMLKAFDGWMTKVPTMSRGFVGLEHDLYKQTVDAAVAIINKAAKVSSLKIQTVPQCIGYKDPYVEGAGPTTVDLDSNNTDKSGDAQAAETSSANRATFVVLPIASIIVGFVTNFI